MNAKDRLGRTALHHAARRGHSSVVRVLLDAPEGQGLAEHGVFAGCHGARRPCGGCASTPGPRSPPNPCHSRQYSYQRDCDLKKVDDGKVLRLPLVDKADEASVRPKFSSDSESGGGGYKVHTCEQCLNGLAYGDDGEYEVTAEEDALDRLRSRRVSVAGHTAVHLAASQDNVEVVSYLLQQRDVDTNAADHDYGMTPLHCAVRTGAVRTVKALCRVSNLDSKVDVNAQLAHGGPIPRIRVVTRAKHRVLQEGDTALHLAIRYGSRAQAHNIALRGAGHLVGPASNVSFMGSCGRECAVRAAAVTRLERRSGHGAVDIVRGGCVRGRRVREHAPRGYRGGVMIAVAVAGGVVVVPAALSIL